MADSIRFINFQGWKLDVVNQELVKDGGGVAALHNETDYRILKCLVDNAGRVVIKDELLKAGWGNDTFVGENNLNQAIGRLRDAFKELELSPEIIKTVPRRGYRFDANLTPEKGRRHTWAVVLAICIALGVVFFVIAQVLSKRNHTAQAGNSGAPPAVQPNQRDIDCDDLMPVGAGKYWHVKPKEGIRFVLRDIKNVRFQESVLMEYFGKNEVRRSSLGLSKYDQILTVEPDGITVHTGELYVQGYYRASMHMLDTQTGVVFPCPFFAYVGYRSCPKCVEPPLERIR